jgi:hypothetical protein
MEKETFAKLSKTEQAKVEAKYHRMKPEDFDETMSRASHETPTALRLPPRLVEDLQRFAERQGKSDFRKMAKTWIEERLRKEANVSR